MTVCTSHSLLPLVLRVRSDKTDKEVDADEPTCYETLATTLIVEQEGYVVERRTKVTSVGRETTDDT